MNDTTEKIEEENVKADTTLPNIQSLFFALMILDTVVGQIAKLAPKSKTLQNIKLQLDNVIAELKVLIGA